MACLVPTVFFFVFFACLSIFVSRIADKGLHFNDDAMPDALLQVYVRPGGIVTLGPVIQYTAQMPGGPLEVHIYTGIDGSFTLVEDDGETLDYQTGVARATTFSWSDITSTVSWTVTGAAAKCAQVRATTLAATPPPTSHACMHAWYPHPPSILAGTM